MYLYGLEQMSPHLGYTHTHNTTISVILTQTVCDMHTLATYSQDSFYSEFITTTVNSDGLIIKC